MKLIIKAEVELVDMGKSVEHACDMCCFNESNCPGTKYCDRFGLFEISKYNVKRIEREEDEVKS